MAATNKDTAKNLRALAQHANDAADHLEMTGPTAAGAGKGAFDWTKLLTLISTVLPAILALFTTPPQPQPQPQPPTPPSPPPS